MSANHRIIFLCVVLILVPNFIKPPDVAATEADFELGFCPPVFLLDLVQLKDHTFQWSAEAMDGFNKGGFENGNGFSGFFDPVSVNGKPVSDKEPKKNGYNIKERIANNAYYEFLHMPQDAYYEFAFVFFIVLAIACGYGLVGSLLGVIILKIWYYFRT